MPEMIEYKCPSCGGAIQFDSSIQKMKCPYCDTEFDMESLKARDDVLNNPQNDNMTWETQPGGEWQQGEEENMAVYVCNSCGGQIVADSNTVATSCPYCGNPVVMTGRLSGNLKPDYVIPFKMDKEAAKEGLNRHVKGKILLPKMFKDQNHIDEIKGIYIPFWLFDADVNARMLFKASKRRHWSDGDYNYTDTSYYSVSRAGSLSFSKVPVDGSSKMPDDIMESIEPFNFNEAVDFQTAYLAGYLADKYDVDAQQSISNANERIKMSTEEVLTDTVNGYSQVIAESKNFQLSNGKAKYALYPVWLLNTTYNDEQYTFAMNGQTGKFVGDLPMDKGAFARWLGGLTVGFGIITYAIAFLVNLF